MAKLVINKMHDKYNKLLKIVLNMTHIFQPLDLTVNRTANTYMNKQFTNCYSAYIDLKLDIDKDFESISIQLKMSVFKSLQRKK